MTHRTDIRHRIRELGTAVPEPFMCAYAYKVPDEELSNIEAILHDNYSDKRVGNSEFFRVTPETVDKLMRGIGKFEPMTTAVQKEINDEEAKRKKAPNMDFLAMGLPVGTVLRFKKDTSITCTVIDNKRVSYNGRTTSLSKLTQQLLCLSYGVQPSPFWMTEDGRLLINIYKEYTRAHVADAQAQGKAAAKQTKKH